MPADQPLQIVDDALFSAGEDGTDDVGAERQVGRQAGQRANEIVHAFDRLEAAKIAGPHTVMRRCPWQLAIDRVVTNAQPVDDDLRRRRAVRANDVGRLIGQHDEGIHGEQAYD